MATLSDSDGVPDRDQRGMTVFNDHEDARFNRQAMSLLIYRSRINLTKSKQ